MMIKGEDIPYMGEWADLKKIICLKKSPKIMTNSKKKIFIEGVNEEIILFQVREILTAEIYS